MQSSSGPRPFVLYTAVALVILGAVLAVLVARPGSASTGCVFCAVTVAGAVVANAWAAGFLAAGLAVLGIGMVATDGGRGSSRPYIILAWILLVAGAVAAFIVMGSYATGPFATLAEKASTIAATAMGLIFLYLAVLVFLLGVGGVLPGIGGGPSKQAAPIPVQEEAEHIMSIEGIGPKYATRLNAQGIITIPQLLRADSMTIAKAADTTHQQAEVWQAEGALSQVKDIGPQFAEMLALAGIRSVQQLASADVDDLMATIDAIEERRKTYVLKTDVKRHHVEKFVQAARQHLAG